MIQRIQTIYFLLTIAVAVLFLSGEIISFQNGSSIELNGIHTATGENLADQTLSTWPLTLLGLLVPVLALILIFLYKKRNFQMNFTLFLILVIIMLAGAVIYFSMAVMKRFSTETDFGIRLILPLIMLILAVLAYRGIKKDEEIVKSYDRLR